jgi:hypothetical protein
MTDAIAFTPTADRSRHGATGAIACLARMELFGEGQWP